MIRVISRTPEPPNPRTRRGLSFIEALVAVALLGIGIAGAMGALGAMINADAIARERSDMARLAFAKIEELRATGDFALAPLSGDFEDLGESRYGWEATLDPTGIENLDQITVTVNKRNVRASASEAVSTLVLRTPTSAVGGTP
jgi:Tfp pilus assembly protein PilV